MHVGTNNLHDRVDKKTVLQLTCLLILGLRYLMSLQGRCKRHIQDLQVDVTDGVCLAEVVEAVSKSIFM